MAARGSILIVDDEEKILEVVASYLEPKGFQVYTAGNGRAGLEIFARESISLVILDLMLPDITGEEICQILRKSSRVPIIMLTAKNMEEDLLNGLHIGADDYMTKPFSLKELYARIEAILRRSGDSLTPLARKFSWDRGNLQIDFERMEVKKHGETVSLTPKEWSILSALMKYPQKVFSREELLELVFGPEFDGYDRVVDTHIKNLRMKIEDDPRKPVYVKTVHGLGYRFGGEAG